MKSIADIALSAKFAASSAAATMVSGFSYFIGLIPDDIGKLASLLGSILTIVMLGYWRAQTEERKSSKKKIDVETSILQLQLEAAQREANHKRRATDEREG